MVLKSHRESAPGHASVPSTLCRFSIVPTLPLSAVFHESGRRPDPTSGCWREQGGGITTRRQPITSVRRALHSPADGRRAWRDNESRACGAASSTRKRSAAGWAALALLDATASALPTCLPRSAPPLHVAPRYLSRYASAVRGVLSMFDFGRLSSCSHSARGVTANAL
jgi:hypothetical protein